MKKLYSVILMLIVSLTAQLSAATFVSGTSADGLAWDLSDDGVLTISGSGPMTDYGKPQDRPWNTYADYVKQIKVNAGVTSIGENAFTFLFNLTMVIVSPSVTTIGRNAFLWCSDLQTIVLPEGLTEIKSGAFTGCEKLEYLNIPTTLTSLGASAFKSCELLNNLVLPAALANIDDEVFAGCWALDYIKINRPTPPAIKANSFGGLDLSAIVLEVPSCDAATDYCAADVWRDFNVKGPDKRTLTVKSDNPLQGSVTGTADVYCGQYSPISATPATGYDFDRWQDGNTEQDRTVRVLDDDTYTAYFKVKTFTVTFYDADDNVLESQTVNYGESAVAPSDPVKDCHNFTGWDKDFTNVQSDLDVRPNFTLKTFTVTFFDAENNVIGTPETVPCGTSATAPADPVKDCYTFTGWDTDFTNVQSDLEVRPLFDQIPYTVRFFDADNQQIGSDQTVLCGESAVAPSDPVKDCHNFTGWDKDFTNVQSDLDVHPNFTLKTFTVTFFDAENNVLGTPETVPCGTSATAPADPVKDCYTFTGWDTDFTNVQSDLEVRPLFDQIPYTVRFFDADNQQIGSDQTILCGESAVAPSDPEKDCHNFTGWDKDFTNVQSDLDVHPNFTLKTFTVTFFDAENNVLGTPETVLCGKDATAPADPVKDCYTFTGWDTDFTNVQSDLEVRPLFDQIPYTVRFFDADNQQIGSDQTVLCGESAVAPSDPEKTCATFDKWDKDYTNVQSNLDVYPLFNDITYTVTFFDAENNVIGTPETVLCGTSATAPADPVKACYTFTGWDTDFTNVQSDLEVRPLFDQIPYTVRFFDADNQQIGADQAVLCGESAVAPSDPEKTCATFDKWDKDYTNVQSDLDVYPIFNDITYTVTFFDADNNVIGTPETVLCGTSATAPADPVKACYTFTGWDTDFTNVQSDLEVRPLFDQIPYTVRFFDADNQQIGADQAVLCGESAVAPSDPEKTCATFDKWDKDYTNVQSNLDVYPIFNDITYTVTFFDADNNVIGTPETVPCGTSATAPADPVKDCYTFTGWDTDFTNVQSDLEVRPLFDQIPYTVRFFDADNQQIGADQAVLCGESAVAPSDPEKTCATFDKWDKDYTNVQSDLDVYPIFNDITYTVTFFDADNNVIGTPQSVLCGDAAVAPSDPVKACATFTGWDKDFTNVQSDLEIRPQFDMTKYNVRFFGGADGNTVVHTSEVECFANVSADELQAAADAANAAAPDCKEVDGWTLFEANKLSLPITNFTAADLNNTAVNKDGEVVWNDAEGEQTGHLIFDTYYTLHKGIQIADWKNGFNTGLTNDWHQFTISFFGVPGQISFTAITEGVYVAPKTLIAPNGTPMVVSGSEWKVEEQNGTTGVWTQIWNSTAGNGSVSYSQDVTLPLNSESRAVRISRKGNFTAFVQNLKLTKIAEANPLENVTSDIDVRAVYVDATYDLTLTNDGNGTAAIVDDSDNPVTGPFGCLTTQKIVATPASECYSFKQWDDGNTDNPRYVLMNGDKQFEAQFKENTFNVRFLGGAAGTTVLHTVSVGCHSSVPAAEYSIAQAEATSPANMSACFTFTGWDKTADNVTADIDIHAQYTAIPYVLTVKSENSNFGTVTGGGTYDCGATATLTATANAGYAFDFWEGDDSQENPHTVTVESDKTYIAHFKEQTYTVFFKYDGLVFHKLEDLPYGYMLTTADAQAALANFEMPECMTVDYWDGIPTEVTEDKVITLNLKPQQNTLTVTTDDNAKGSVIILGDNVTTADYDCGSSHTILATATTGSEFDHWTDSKGNDYPDNPLDVILKEDLTFTAVFKTRTFDVVFTLDGAKFYEINDVEYGKQLTDQQVADALAALPLPDCATFDKWDALPSAITADTEIKALVKTATYNIEVLTDDNLHGTAIISGDNVKSGTYNCGTVLSLLATPATGYEFDRWTDAKDSELTNNPLSVVLTEDAAYTAHFKIKTYVVSFTYNSEKFFETTVEHGSPLTSEQLAEAKTALASVLGECRTFDAWVGLPAQVISDTEVQATAKTARAHITVSSEDNSKGTAVIAIDNVTIATYDCGEIKQLVATAKEGYEFDHWSDNTNENPHTIVVGDADAEYVAYFNIKHYTVTFLNCDGTLIDEVSVEHGQGATAPTVTPPAGSSFKGWNDNSFMTNVTADMTITALCDINQMVVRFYDFDGNQIDLKTVDYGGSIDPLSVVTPAKAGLTFTGWDHSLDNITEDLDVHPLFTVNRLTVYFYNGTELVATSEADYGSAPDIVPTVTKTGYTFIGWDPDIEHVTIDGLQTYAQFNIVKYNVDFLNLNDNVLASFAVEYGSTVITPPAAPVVDGYHFVGWDQDFSIVTSDMTIRPVYELNQYTVHFVDWDNTLIADRAVEHGGTVVAPDAPLHEGHSFAGWDRELSNITTDGLVIKALYDKNTYNVTFMALEQTVSTQQVEYESAAVAPFADQIPQKEGYHFVAWDKDFSSITSDITVTAIYDVNIYQVTFVDYDGTVISGPQDVEWHNDAVAPVDPVRADYIFAGWDKDFTNVEQNLTVKAQYIELYYTVRFFDDLAKSQIGADQQVEYQHAAVAPVVPNHSAEGYHFAYWEPADFSSVTENLDIYAKYEKNIYVVRFIDWNGAQLGADQQVEYGASAVAPDVPEREGYNFTGWDKSFSYITSDLTVTALYEAKVYNVTFKNWDGSVLKIDAVSYGGTATPPADPKRDDYIFVGWDGDYSNVTADVTVIAKFTGEYLTVRFHDYDGTVIWTSVTSYGEPAIAPEEPTREGYEFTGWDKQYLSVTADMDIYAQYKVLSYLVRFFDINTSTPVKEQYVEYEQSATAPQLPEHDGLTFMGWSADFSVIRQAVDIYAQYEAKTWQVTFINYNGQTWKQTVEHGGSAVAPALEERFGYDFAGWSGGDYEHVVSDLTLIAQYNIKQYKVTFVDYLGELSTQTVQHGGNATAPVARVPEGQQFSGWDAQFNFVTADLTVNATYSYSTFTVTFRDYDGTLLSSQEVAYGGSAVAPTQPTRDGYAFLEWDTPFTNITHNTTVTALYRKDILEVTFREWNGEVIEVVKVQYGGTPLAPAPKEREGYHFTGWDQDIHGVYENMDVRALYELNEYQVTARSSDIFMGVVTGGGYFKHGEEATVTALPDEEYEFVAWLDENTMKPVESLTAAQVTITVTSDTALVALFRLKSFSLTFDRYYTVCPGETVVLPSGIELTPEQDVEVEDVVHYEYIPDVWCDSIFNCHISVYTKPEMPAVNLLPTVVYLQAVELEEATESVRSALDNAKLPSWSEIDSDWWEWLVDEQWTRYEDEIIASYDTLTMRYGIATACGDTLYTEPMLVKVAKQNADNCKDCQVDFVAVIIYDWMLMLDKATLNDMGYVFPADSVAWYKVVDGLDDLNQPELADDEEVGRGFYYTVDYTLAGTGDTYYAIVYLPEQSDDVPCHGILRSGMLQFSLGEQGSEQNQILLRPTLAVPSQTITITGLNPEETTTIRVYSSTGQLAETFTSNGQTEVSFTGEVTSGAYMVYIDSETRHAVKKYIVKQ